MTIEDLERRLADVMPVLQGIADDMIRYASNPANVATAETATRTLLMTKLSTEKLDMIKKLVSKQNEVMKNVTVPTLFNQNGVKTISVDGYRFSVSVRLSASIPDKEAGYQWLRDNNLGDIIKPTVNAMTLASTAKELIEEGLELDPDLFKVSYNENTSVTRVKGT